MKKLLPLLLLTLLLCSPALAEYVTFITPPPTAAPELTLRPSSDEVKVYASQSQKANIVGYIIVGGRQEVNILSIQGSWVKVSFTSIYGLSEGWIPLSCFEPVATATPTPTPAPSNPQSNDAFIRNPQPGYRLNLRTSPSASATSLGKYYTGTPVTLTGEIRSGFVRVRIGSVSGWLDMRYVTTDPYSFVNELKHVSVINPGSGANLRAGAGTGTQRIGWYPHGTSVTILGVREDEWYHVAVAGQTGYMSSSLLSQTFPWQFGTDSDSSGVNGGIPGDETTAYVSAGNGAYLREQASAGSALIGVFYSGCPLTIVSYTRTGWAYVRIGELSGYMDASSLSASRPSRTGQTRTIINPYGTGLNLRTQPNTSSTVLSLCRNYATVSVLGDLADDWCYVVVGTQYGYMMGTRLVSR